MGDDLYLKGVQKRLPPDVRIEYLSATTEWVLTWHHGQGFPTELRRVPNEESLNWRRSPDIFAHIARYELHKRGAHHEGER